MLFKAKKQEIDSDGSDMVERLKGDFVVHNMPAPVSSEGTTNKTSLAAPENHKKTGMIIISLGILLVIGLLYGVYILVIKPSLKSNVSQEVPLAVEEPVVTPENIQAVVIPPVASSTVIATETPEISPTSTTNIEQPVVVPSVESIIDTDSDGLSDEEEKLIGSNPNKIDTDSDGNADLIEVQNTYNPAGSGRLASSSMLNNYRNPSLKYSLIYPKSWSIKNLNGNETVLISSVDEKYFIQILHQNNENNLDIVDWYQAEFPGQEVGEGRSATDGSWIGVYNADKSVFYLNDKAKKNIYIFSLTAAEGSAVNYFRLFELVINNFKLNSK
ncbi:MAG: thrombospondin type 3 repeat-containing protein [Patescibacteria group bacterium]